MAVTFFLKLKSSFITFEGKCRVWMMCECKINLNNEKSDTENKRNYKLN